jgi:UDP:flavonoid glycosyltransferase YjiC (YdhE family)
MKVLCASVPADGHFNPLTGVAAHLQAVGHDVRWYAGPEYGAKLDRLGMTHLPYRRATEITAGNLNDRFPERARLKGPKAISFDLEKFFVTNVDNHFQDIAEIRSEFAFDVFVCDGALYAEQLVAEVLEVPVFAVGSSLVMPDHDSPPPFFGLRPARTIVGRTMHRVVRRMVASAVKPGVITYNQVLASHGVAPIPLDGFPDAPMASARRVFLNGSPGLEFPGYRPPANAEFVGALVPVRGTVGPETPLPPPVVDPDARVVLVSQGTVDNTDPTKLIAPTLEALADGPYVVVATTGGVQTPELRARFASPNVIIEDFVDYDALFPHLDVVVSNCTVGSFHAAMRHGVPVVGAGRSEGKNDVAARIGYNRLGIDLRTERPKPARIRAAVHRVLGDPAYAANVEAVRAELESYDPGARIEAALQDESLAAQ